MDKKLHRKNLSKKYYQLYKDEIKIKAKQWRQRNPDYTKNYTATHRDKKREYHKQWRLKKKQLQLQSKYDPEEFDWGKVDLKELDQFH
jgi:hypothetical protein